LKPIPILLTVLVITIVGLSLISVPVAAAGVGTWKSTKNNYPITISNQSCVVYGVYIYCVAGASSYGFSVSAVYFASLSSSGGVGVWKSTTSYPTYLTGESCVGASAYIFCVGGQDDGVFTNAVYFALLSSSGGIRGNWMKTTSYPTVSAFQSCDVQGRYIYCVGGANSLYGPSTSNVQFARWSSSGLGAWKLTTAYPTPIQQQSCKAHGGYIYCVGGASPYGGYNSPTNAVYFASLSSSGVGKWKSASSYPIIVMGESCHVYGGYIYCIGGSYGSDFIPLWQVYFASLHSSGVGTWSLTTGYPQDIYYQACNISGSYIYCVGGYTGANIISSVYFASV